MQQIGRRWVLTDPAALRNGAEVYLMPSIFPSLFRLPCFVVGIPVALAILRFAEVIPNARFQLKDRPGIFREDFFFAISLPPQ
jgi:hypothetical protein